jgi:hypothetical protein
MHAAVREGRMHDPCWECLNILLLQEQWTWNYLDCIEETYRSGSCDFNSLCRAATQTLLGESTAGNEDTSGSSTSTRMALISAIVGAVFGGVLVAVGVHFMQKPLQLPFARRGRSSSRSWIRLPLSEHDSSPVVDGRSVQTS